MADYKVRLDVFEGPMDLLLHLIKEQELNIYDIPISRITKQYFEYLDLMKDLDLEIAGEFLVMASTLTLIKSKMLLPKPELEGEEEAEDPRDELVRRLIEYKKYKEASLDLKVREERQLETFSRNFISEWDEDDADYLKEVSVFSLLGAFKKMLDTLDPEKKFYEVRLEEVSVTEKMTYILDVLEKEPRRRFEDLFQEARSRMELVGTLLAMLELMKQQYIRVFQEKLFGPIWVQAVEEASADLRDGEVETVSAVREEFDDGGNGIV